MKKNILIVEAGSEYQKGFLIRSLQGMQYNLFLLQSALFKGQNAWVREWFDPQNIIEIVNVDCESVFRTVTDFMRRRGVAFDGVMTFWEAFVPLTHELQKRLGLPEITGGDIGALRHKGKMRECVQSCSMKQPKFTIVKDTDPVPLVRKYPVIVKPAELASSLGVVKVDSAEELAAAVDAARKADFEGFPVSVKALFGLSNDVLVEEYVRANNEFSFEGIVYEGKLTVVAICQKLKRPEPKFWEYGEISPPPDMPYDLQQEISRKLQDVVSALSLQNSAIHAELRVKDDAYSFIELGARIGGFPIPEIVEKSTGTNLMRLAVPVACGLKPEIGERTSCRFAGDYNLNTVHIPLPEPIAISKRKKDAISRLSGVVFSSFRDTVDETVFGDVIVVADSVTEIYRVFEQVKGILEAAHEV